MKVELVPVIEIGYSNQEVPIPDKGPYWEYPEAWDEYNNASYIKAGFKDRLIPYAPGASVYDLKRITDSNLAKIIIDHTADMRAGEYDRLQASPLFGGYVLKINGSNVHFPQCCSDLSEIKYWESLADNKQPFIYHGHPEPHVTVDADHVKLNFEFSDTGEAFVPPLPTTEVIIDRQALKAAIHNTKKELHIFAERIKKINADGQLGIEDIDMLLVWDE